jgi:MoaA/NifB/PqqE/SkfB family radical SAM enzyme
MIVRHYVQSREYRRRLVPYLRRVLWRTLFSTHWRAFVAMLLVTLRRAVVWLPMKLKARRLGVRLPLSLQLVDEIGCKAACANCVFSAFEARKERLDFPTLERLLGEALGLNITYVYLMGADPFYRDDADEFLDLLARHRRQIFFLFTEGKRVTDAHLARIRRAGNILLVMNIDGLREASDQRKGPGSFEIVDTLLCKMRDAKMPYFVTTMVSRANHAEVTGPEFVRWLDNRGAWVVAYLPYTPLDLKAERDLVMDAAMREALFERSIALNREVRRLVVLDLLGIEQHLTACPAAVYSITIFHDGTVTPCPAATFGDVQGNVRERSLEEIFVRGRLYREIRALHGRGDGPVHCLFYTDKAFFRDYLARNRDTVRILNPGVLEALEEDCR